MTIEQLNAIAMKLEIEQAINSISTARNEIKLLFTNVEVTLENTNYCIQIVQILNRKDIFFKKTNEFQFLFVQLAIYFKKANRAAYVLTCVNNLTDSILKNRLVAWHQYKNYTQRNSHINRFEAYLTKLSDASLDQFEEYFDDILLDLHIYNSEYPTFPEFQELFEREDLLNKFFLLKEYQKKKNIIGYRVEQHETVDKIYTPSVFSENLFNDKFISYIKHHKKTNWNKILLGYDNYTVRAEIIKYGQANFDSNYQEIKAHEVVKLYCYFNMRKHYYSSLYLFERCSWLRAEIVKGCTKFIDIGCGPATSGIALIDYLQLNGSQFVPFDYIGVDYYQSMLDSAADLMNNGTYKASDKQLYIKNLNLIDRNDLVNANAIIINTCYLFASPNLDVDILAHEINVILNLNNKPRFLMFQNTATLDKNINYEKFKSKLIAHDVLLSEKKEVKYNNQRNSYYPPTSEIVYFEVLKF